MIDSLLKHVKSRLAASKFCIVFESELERIWPFENKEKAIRVKAIEAFAKSEWVVSSHSRPWYTSDFQEAERLFFAIANRSLEKAFC